MTAPTHAVRELLKEYLQEVSSHPTLYSESVEHADGIVLGVLHAIAIVDTASVPVAIRRVSTVCEGVTQDAKQTSAQAPLLADFDCESPRKRSFERLRVCTHRAVAALDELRC